MAEEICHKYLEDWRGIGEEGVKVVLELQSLSSSLYLFNNKLACHVFYGYWQNMCDFWVTDKEHIITVIAIVKFSTIVPISWAPIPTEWFREVM